MAAAPPLPVLQRWAPPTSTPCSCITHKHLDFLLPIPNAQPAPSPLRRWIFAVHHYQLLSEAPAARQPSESRPFSGGDGAGAAPPSFCGRGPRGPGEPTSVMGSQRSDGPLKVLLREPRCPWWLALLLKALRAQASIDFPESAPYNIPAVALPGGEFSGYHLSMH